VLELCASVPPSLRPSLLSGKALFRRAVAPWLPAEIVARPKSAFNAGALPLSRALYASAGNPELKQLLERRAIEDKGYFDWSYCRQLVLERNFLALDHVLIVQLLDELFVSRFDPERFATPPAPPVEELAPRAAATVVGVPRPAVPGATEVPRLSRSLARISLHAAAALDGSALEPPSAAAEFVEPRPSVRVSPDALRILQLVDGRRSWAEIAARLDGAVRLPTLLEFAAVLIGHGILEGAEACS
jgi:hypothetical protein